MKTLTGGNFFRAMVVIAVVVALYTMTQYIQPTEKPIKKGVMAAPFTFKHFPRIIDNQNDNQQALTAYIKTEFSLTASDYCQSSFWPDKLACLQFLKQETSDTKISEYRRYLLATIESLVLTKPKLGQASGNAWQLAMLYDQHAATIRQFNDINYHV